jgi:SAM-dependent methyltransferase
MVCEVCGGAFGSFSLDLGSHPLCDDLTPIGSDLTVPKFHQLISLCEHCLTAHQMVPVEKELLFKPTYHYRAALTKDVLSGMLSLVQSLESELRPSEKSISVLDIGCNDGSLLGIFKEIYGCTTIGVDPTGAILESGSKVDFKFNEYFTDATASSIRAIAPVIDLITFTNVFAHIENLPGLLENLGSLISDSTTLVIENHYLGAILNRNQFDTFYHEHPRTYSLRSFQHVATSLGLVITNVEFPSRYGGNIRVTMKKFGTEADLTLYSAQEEGFIDAFLALQNAYDEWRSHSLEVVAKIADRGLFYGKALPGRAVMLISALDISERMMPKVFEQPKSPKVGNNVPGTKIEIQSDDDLLEFNPDVLIIWSWHIVDEIVKYLDSLGYRGEIWVPLPEFRLYRPAL